MSSFFHFGFFSTHSVEMLLLLLLQLLLLLLLLVSPKRSVTLHFFQTVLSWQFICANSELFLTSIFCLRCNKI